MGVLLAPEAQRQFERLPTLIKVRILGVFERLRSWPNVSGAKPLRAPLAGQFRIRTGDYRVQFRAQEDIVIVVKLGHRDRFYDE
jgi:mRNA-degrading endonuclease RelE of RelBE toxin-antitoxin system